MTPFHMDPVQAIVPSRPRYRGYQPGKRTIFLSVLLSLMLLFSQIFSSLRYRKPPKLSWIGLHKDPIPEIGSESDVPCLKNFLGTDSFSLASRDSTSCQRLPPARGFCSLIQKLFHQSAPQNCSHQEEVSFCEMEKGQITCSVPPECKKSDLSVGQFDPFLEEGVKWEKVPRGMLQETVSRAWVGGGGLGRRFVYIKCSGSDLTTDLVQLFLFGGSKSSGSVGGGGRADADADARESGAGRETSVNLNVIMIDSVSRDHFYRSLPRTVKRLERMEEGGTHRVVDFRSFQALKQRTFESLEALFSGYVDTDAKPFGTYDNPSYPLPVHVLFEKYKKKGYKTLWLEDLCWHWEWGLSKDLKVVEKNLDLVKSLSAVNEDSYLTEDDKSAGLKELWGSFQEALKEARIDDVGVTLASCPILRSNGLNDPFHKAPSVCFNGQYHHEYILRYLELYQTEMGTSSNNYFSFTQINVGHEETGVRVQSLDLHLENYLDHVQNLPNTVTVLFSDHGNTYGTFLEASSEAYVETFSPFLFLLVPNSLSRHIGETKLENLEKNSRRLVTLIDVHETLLDLIGGSNVRRRSPEFLRKFVVNGGLFGNIPAKRTCNDVPLLTPTLCICKDFELSVAVENRHYALAEFGIWAVNNMILRQRTHSGRYHGFGSCQLLIVQNIRSVREARKTVDNTQYKIDLVVTGVLSPQPEVFFLVVELGVDVHGRHSTSLLSFERNSLYSKYKTCKDEGVDAKLCTCVDNRRNNKWNFLNILVPNFLNFFYTQDYGMEKSSEEQILAFLRNSFPAGTRNIDEKFPQNDPCLFVVRHQFDRNFNVFGVNFCPSVHKVTLEVVSENFYLSSPSKSLHLLKRLDTKLLLSGMILNAKLKSSWDYRIVIE